MLRNMGNTGLRQTMKVPQVDLAGCDVFLWRDGDEFYWLETKTGEISQVREGWLAELIQTFPVDRALCIMNDQTGKPVRISPLAN